tara:strand:+ start:256 stop:372 length:117 start_codon:yes stop_codon:yes gene_type:complete
MGYSFLKIIFTEINKQIKINKIVFVALEELGSLLKGVG